jgi:hypothetical protein
MTKRTKKKTMKKSAEQVTGARRKCWARQCCMTMCLEIVLRAIESVFAKVTSGGQTIVDVATDELDFRFAFSE